MVALSRKTDYALVALAALARQPSSTISVREMADRLGVPLRLLANILNKLTRRALVVSARGPQGGYRLARAPELITVAELIEAIDGPPRLTLCCNEGLGTARRGCTLQDTCGITEPVRRLHDGLCGLLRSVTIRDIAFNTVRVGLNPRADAESAVAGGSCLL